MTAMALSSDIFRFVGLNDRIDRHTQVPPALKAAFEYRGVWVAALVQTLDNGLCKLLRVAEYGNTAPGGQIRRLPAQAAQRVATARFGDAPLGGAQTRIDDHVARRVYLIRTQHHAISVAPVRNGDMRQKRRVDSDCGQRCSPESHVCLRMRT